MPQRTALIATAVLLSSGFGLLIGDGKVDVVVALAGVLGVLLTMARVWTLRTARAFVHGYHAGYHDGCDDYEVTSEPCAVIELAERSHERLRSLPA